VAVVIVDAENVRRSLWPNLTHEEARRRRRHPISPRRGSFAQLLMSRS
jgi:hypothetical protein